MTKNVEYEISFFEIIKLLITRWKLLLIIMLLCVVLCGGYKAIFYKGVVSESQSLKDYERDMQYYDYLSETQQQLPPLLKEEWKRVCFDKTHNPIFSINPYNCEYEQIVIRFSDEGKNHDWTVNNWIVNSDNQELFGAQELEYSDYKCNLIVIANNKKYSETSETAVQIFAVKDFDAKKAANVLMQHFKQSAKEENIIIDNISKVSVKGYNSYVDDYQQNSRDKYNSIYSNFMYSKSMNSYITAPVDPSAVQNNKSKIVIKFCLIGLILGLMLGIAYIVFDAIRKRELLSKRQIENAFNLELLSDCSQNSAAAIDVLNANLDVMTGEHSNIAIIVDDNNTETIGEIASKWSENSDRSYILCTDIFDNPKMIEALRTADGIVMGVKLGTSKLEQIQRVLLRANKLNLRVLGYVII